MRNSECGIRNAELRIGPVIVGARPRAPRRPVDLRSRSIYEAIRGSLPTCACVRSAPVGATFGRPPICGNALPPLASRGGAPVRTLGRGDTFLRDGGAYPPVTLAGSRDSKLGTSQTSFVRRAFLARRYVSRASGCPLDARGPFRRRGPAMGSYGGPQKDRRPNSGRGLDLPEGRCPSLCCYCA